MDTSETYIKMCERAAEIQRIKPEWAGIFGEGVCITTNGDWFWEKDRVIDNDVWLPRQDQLQAMMAEEFWTSLYNFINSMVDRDGNALLPKEYGEPESWEQLWLGFVMYEKFIKVWDGSEWVR